MSVNRRGMSMRILTDFLELGRHGKVLVTDEDWKEKLSEGSKIIISERH